MWNYVLIALNQDNYDNYELTIVMDIEAPDFENTVTLKFATNGRDSCIETILEGMKFDIVLVEKKINFCWNKNNHFRS